MDQNILKLNLLKITEELIEEIRVENKMDAIKYFLKFLDTSSFFTIKWGLGNPPITYQKLVEEYESSKSTNKLDILSDDILSSFDQNFILIFNSMMIDVSFLVIERAKQIFKGNVDTIEFAMLVDKEMRLFAIAALVTLKGFSNLKQADEFLDKFKISMFEQQQGYLSTQ